MFLFRANKLPLLSSVLKETLRLECLNNLMINLACLPTYENLAHLCCVFPSLCSRSSFIGLSLLQLLYHICYYIVSVLLCRSQWPRGLRRRSAAARLLVLWVRVPPGAWMSLCCECCVLSGRGPCDNPIIRPEESYRLGCVVVCDLETSCMRRSWPNGAIAPKTNICFVVSFSFLFSDSFIGHVDRWLVRYLIAASLCSEGWRESLSMMSVAVSFLYMPNIILLSYWETDISR